MPRTDLTVARIVAVACEILDAEGPEGLTVRRLARELGVGVASLYWYVSDKDDLLAKCAEQVARELPIIAAQGDWLDALRRQFVLAYETAERHPWFLLVQSHHRTSAMGMLGSTIHALSEAGLSDADVFDATSTLFLHLSSMVQVLAETRYAADARTREEVLDDSARGLLEQVASAPAVQRYVRRLRTHTERAQYEGGLDLILAGIQARRGGEARSGRGVAEPRTGRRPAKRSGTRAERG
jgi:AcrR family transcriptional regulator